MWFTECCLHGAGAARITPAGVVTEFATGPGASSYGVGLGIASGPNGDVWFADLVGRVGGVTVTGTISEMAAGVPADASPVDIAEGPDGSMWVTERAANAIARVTVSGRTGRP